MRKYEIYKKNKQGSACALKDKVHGQDSTKHRNNVQALDAEHLNKTRRIS